MILARIAELPPEAGVWEGDLTLQNMFSLALYGGVVIFHEFLATSFVLPKHLTKSTAVNRTMGDANLI